MESGVHRMLELEGSLVVIWPDPFPFHWFLVQISSPISLYKRPHHLEKSVRSTTPCVF